MSRTRSHLPGGELIGPYLDEVARRNRRISPARPDRAWRPRQSFTAPGDAIWPLIATTSTRNGNVTSAGSIRREQPTTRCLVGRLSNDSGSGLATIVNYACHPTTLAWDNTLISPDWVGAMREVVEKSEGGLCLFCQGASGDLGPREGFVGDTSVADRNGRQVGHAALSALAALPPAGTEYRYAGPVISGHGHRHLAS